MEEGNDIKMYENNRVDLADSLITIDYPIGLTPLQLSYCRHRAVGLPATKAMMKALQDTGEVVNKQGAGVRAASMSKNPLVIEYIQLLNRKIESDCILNSAQIQAYLTQIIQASPEELDDSNMLIQGKTITKTKSGDTVVNYILPNKLSAVKMLIDIQGLNSPIKVEHEVKGGIAVVPHTPSIDEWESNVKERQKKLMEDAINV